MRKISANQRDRLRNRLAGFLPGGILSLLLLLFMTRLLLAETVIKFATVAPRNSTWMNIMEELDREIRERTGDGVRFKIYPGGVQGDERDVIRKIRFGQLHGGGFTGLGLGLIQPQARVLDLPYLFRDSEEADVVLEGLFDEFAQLFAEKEFLLLGWAEVGFVHFFTVEPMRSIEDLRKQKMWIWEGDPLASAYFRELDLKPIPLSLPDVLTSFQTGLINGAYASPYGASVLQWQTRVNYVSDRPMADASGAVLISMRTWNKLEPAEQEVLREVGRRRLRELTLASRRDNAAALAAFRQAGIELMAARSPDEQAKFEELGRRVQDKLAGDLYDAALLERVRGLVAGLRSESGD